MWWDRAKIMKVRKAGVERGALCMLMIFPLLCPTAKGRFKHSLSRENGKLNMSKDSHIFWHVAKTCPTPGGHHKGAVLLRASFLSPVPERRGNSYFAAIFRFLWHQKGSRMLREGRAWAAHRLGAIWRTSRQYHVWRLGLRCCHLSWISPALC